MSMEKYYKIILEKINSIFSELNFIGSSIQDELESGNPNNVSLKLNEVKYYLGVVRQNDKYFHKCIEGTNNDWDLIKKIEYNIDKISSFNRQFEAVFFGTEKWYQRVVSLLDQLSEESRELGRLLEIKC